MEPNKFEKHIKSELKQREIQPSAAAWSKLSKELDEVGNEEKNTYKWYAIAASIIGLLVISVIMLSGDFDSTEVPMPVVNTSVEEEQFNDIVKELKEPIEEKIVRSVPSLENAQVPVESDGIENIAVKTSNSQTNGRILEVLDQQNDIASLDEKDDEIIQSKVLEIVAQVDQLEQRNENLTELEVDSLLRKAQREILNEKLFKTDNAVDALALLAEAEEELDQTFRDQIFESLKTGFLKVRTAVADRNN